jgi:hypothetical protein
MVQDVQRDSEKEEIRKNSRTSKARKAKKG